VLFFHFGQNEGLLVGYERQKSAQEIGGIGGNCFLGLPFVHGVNHLCEARVGATQLRDRGIIALNERHERGRF